MEMTFTSHIHALQICNVFCIVDTQRQAKYKRGTSIFTEYVHAPQWINVLDFDDDSSVAYPLSQHEGRICSICFCT